MWQKKSIEMEEFLILLMKHSANIKICKYIWSKYWGLNNTKGNSNSNQMNILEV